MSRSRPINRRPWRRPPWRKSNRTGRWTECNVNSTGANACDVNTQTFVCSADDPAAMVNGTRELISGDLDVEWADKGEVVIDRIVGDINVQSLANVADSQFRVPVLRMGMLVVEEVEDIATWNPPNLFVREDVEEFEWMWLWQGIPRIQLDPTIAPFVNEPAVFRSWENLHLDIRVKRKLGKKDHLVMLHHAAVQASPVSFSAGAVHFLRAMLVG